MENHGKNMWKARKPWFPLDHHDWTTWPPGLTGLFGLKVSISATLLVEKENANEHVGLMSSVNDG